MSPSGNLLVVRKRAGHWQGLCRTCFISMDTAQPTLSTAPDATPWKSTAYLHTGIDTAEAARALLLDHAKSVQHRSRTEPLF